MPAESRSYTAQRPSVDRSLRPNPKRELVVDAMAAYALPITSSQLLAVTGLSVEAVAYQLRSLLGAGLITAELSDLRMSSSGFQHVFTLIDPDTMIVDVPHQMLAVSRALTLPVSGTLPIRTVLDTDAQECLARIVAELTPKVRTIAKASTDRWRESR
jgi:DNA-binding transcriptional ArsR family regulator